jgi:hypothetical protein
MSKYILIVAALMFAGCASMYQPKVTTITLPLPPGAPKGTGAVQVTTFEQWTSMWSAVCGAIVQYENGEPAQMVPGACGTPLTLLMNSPMNIGMGALLAHGL